MGLFDSLLGRNKNNDMGMEAGMMSPMPMDSFMGFPGMQQGMPGIGNINDHQNNTNIAQVTLETDDVVEKFRNTLKGFEIKKRYNPVTKKVEEETIRFGSRFCNDEGINVLTGNLRMHLNKHIMLSNIPDKKIDMINKWMLHISADISKQIRVNQRRWQVNRSLRSNVTNEMARLIESTMLRGLGAGERTGLYGTMKTINTNVTNAQGTLPTQNKGIFGL